MQTMALEDPVMAYRSMLVQVDDASSSKPRIEASVALAARFKSALTGVFLKSDFLALYGAGSALAFVPPESLQLILDEQARAVAKAAATARAAFEGVARDSGIAFDWLEIEGDSDEMLIDCARRHDLTIFPALATASIGQHNVTAGKIGMGSGAPVLVLPASGVRNPIGRRVLVAWKGSRESARALNDAWPFLSEAAEVHILTIRTDGEGGSDPMLERQMRLHGCKSAKIIVDGGDDASTGEILRRHIDTTGADLVVMGLYGHSRLEELVLGGVSRQLLNTLPVPLLVSH
jgi:nucleotide-binding universal stress UspA family protein